MENELTSKTSMLGLFGNLAGETKTFIRQEVQLAKTEISEKISTMGSSAVSLAIGGFVAYAGVIVFLIGFGGFIAWAVAQLGLGPLIASVVGIGGLGLIVTIVGALMVLKALKTLKQQPLAPERTLQTLHDLRSSSAEEQKQAPPSATSAEIQAKVEATEARLSENLEEIGDRLSPHKINAQVRSHIESNPYRAGLIAVVAGFVGGMLLRRRSRHA